MFKQSSFTLAVSFFFFLLPFHAQSQSVTVRSIEISGNKKTKPVIILRELTFREGDTLSQFELGSILERNRNNLINLGIFNQAVVNVSEWDTDQHLIDIIVQVKESWYIYPSPIFDLADRNFNVWWNTYNGALNRVNLGLRLDWLNLTGYNDKLKGVLQFGYTHRQQIEYRFPYLDKKQRIGITGFFQHTTNKETGVATVNNRERFIRIDERVMLERYRTELNFVYRPNIFVKHELSSRYQYVEADAQLVTDYNPILFRNGGNVHKAFTLRYTYEFDNRDVRIYPSRGFLVYADLEKIGIGQQDDENTLSSKLILEWNKPTGRRLQHRISTVGRYSWIRMRPSYMHYQAVGYGQSYIRGYELYLIDGLDYFIGKYQLSFRAIDTKWKIGNWMPVHAFREMPLQFYLSMFLETGYINDPYTGSQNNLANQWLYGGGPGIDIIVYNNFLFQLNFSANHLGEWGLFFHNRTSF